MDDRINKYFQGELTEPERLMFLREVEKNEILKKQFIDFQNMYALLNLSDCRENRSEGKENYQYFFRKKNEGKIRKTVLQWVGYAAAIIVLVVSSCLITIHYERAIPEESVSNTLYVPAGQRARLTLQDGTEVWLNAKSTLVYPSYFGAGERRVTVTGEAFFEVAKDVQKPFIVTTREAEIKVLGTKFNVYSYPENDYMRTSLLEGKVEISNPSAPEKSIVLAPNQQVVCYKGEMMVGNIANNEYFLWKEGIYSFDREKLSSIIRKLELYYDVKIIVEGALNMEMEYTGKFRQRDGIDEILRILQKIQKFTIEKNEDRDIITLRKSLMSKTKK